LRSISIVVPAYNEVDMLPACLASLKAQDYAGGDRILVVDNASTDDTAGVARGLGVRVVPEPVRGYGRALRRGFNTATGDIIARHGRRHDRAHELDLALRGDLRREP